MKEEQKEIYYLYGSSRETIESGPYLEAFKARNLEVLFIYQPIDEFVMNHVREFDGKSLVSADQDEIELDSLTPHDGGEALSKGDADNLCGWFKKNLGEKVESVRTSDRLTDSPALASNADKMMTASMRRIMKTMNQDAPEMAVKVVLHINPRHSLIKNLSSLRQKNEELAKLVAEQVMDNTLVAAGLMEDPKHMLNRVYHILEKVSESKDA